MHKANQLMYKLQELQFSALEVRLYLDTHPFDQKAQQDFSTLTYHIMQIMPQVEQYYGPLLQYGYSKENPVRWIEEPWPWEYKY